MSTRTRFLRGFIVGSLLTGACVGTTAMVARAEPTSAPPSNDGVSAPAARAGQRIYVDPQTGARTAPPKGAVAALPANPALSTSHDGLVEEPAAGGGVTVNLQGRFRSAAEATVGADGTPAVHCHSPGAPDGKE
jgi:hypothetical protein